MSQSSNSTIDINIFSELSPMTAAAKQQVAPNEAGKGIKRPASDEIQGQIKKSMNDYHSAKEQAPHSIPESFNQPKFIRASEMINNARTNEQMMLEISDEELLKMAIEFEKQHPQ